MPTSETRRAAKTVAVLAVTQLVGWGTTFDMLGVLGRVIAPELGLANEIVFLGLSIMMLISALAGPKTGRLLDRYGASKVLAAGSVIFAAGLLLLAASHGLVLYIAAWCVIGLGGALGLSAPAFTAVVEREGQRSGRIIAILMLFTGLSSATFWPLLDWLQSLIGWRLTFVLTASVHLLVCLPLHLFALPRPVASAERTETTERAPLVLTPLGRIYAFSLIAASTMLASGRSPCPGSRLAACFVVGVSGPRVAPVAGPRLRPPVHPPRYAARHPARLSLPQTLASAAAPVIFTGILDRAGLPALLVTASILAALSFFFVILLALFIRGRRA